METSSFDRLWRSDREEDWHEAVEGYWRPVKPTHMDLERDLDQLQPERLQKMNASEWFDFLHDKYFRWKYTQPNRLATTTQHLKRQSEEKGDEILLGFRDDIFEQAPLDLKKGLKAAMQIRGLGTAGASGLLSLIFPEKYGTVDQFIVKRLLEVTDLPELEAVKKMNPEGLTVKEGVLLIEIMQRKAFDLNQRFKTTEWTPERSTRRCGVMADDCDVRIHIFELTNAS